MRAIQLNNRRWFVDETRPLGERGGFGAVFLGSDESGSEVAVKRLNISADEAAHRELSIAQHLAGRSFHNVIPIYDSGLDPESGRYFVVMARAQHSLQAAIQSTGPFGDEVTARTLIEILRGLGELSDIVHRDLKPANVLWHEGRWKIADFGIARFVEEATSLRTLKECLTPSYAAPEQWQSERASSPTDIYALGCIGYALSTGKPPFNGRLEADLKRQHLEEAPPDLPQVHPRLRSALTMMLRKAPEARPSRERATQILAQFLDDLSRVKPVGGGISPLAHVGAAEAARLAKLESEEGKIRVEIQRRERLAREASTTLAEVAEYLLTRIEREAPSATVERPGRGSSGWKASLGAAWLNITKLPTDRNYWHKAFKLSNRDIILGATVVVSQPPPRTYQWGASLWYTTVAGEHYRWWEVGYMEFPLRRTRPFEPFALDSVIAADQAMGPGMGEIQEAYKPRPIDDEDMEDFVHRWIGLLVKAYQGELEHPRYLPLNWDAQPL